MNLLKKIDDGVKHWLMDCFDLVDGTEYRDVIKKYEQSNLTLQKVRGRLGTVCAAIPATTAPWYEDKEFAAKMWEILKDKYIVVRECANEKVAMITVYKID